MNNVFFRLDDNLYNELVQIQKDYKFRSIAELTKTVVRVFANIYKTPKEKTENEIEQIFKDLENGEKVFDYQKPKKLNYTRKGVSLNDEL